MIISRVHPILIRSSRTLKFIFAHKTQTSNSLNHSLLEVPFEANQSFWCRRMASNGEDDFNNPKRHLNYEQFIEKKDKQNVVVIDVRERSEISETGQIPGSINIPLAEVKKALTEMSEEDFTKIYKAKQPKKDNEIIFSCKAGNRSQRALRTGLQLGFDKSESFDGGWSEWEKKSKK